MQYNLEHYYSSYHANENSIGNLKSIIAEIKASSYDILVMAWRLTTLKDIITCEGKRKIYALPLDNLIEAERNMLAGINFILAYTELPQSFRVYVAGISNIADYIANTLEDYILPLIKDSLLSK